jgi:formylglycine-generating enzyme required for sulfatase activity
MKQDSSSSHKPDRFPKPVRFIFPKPIRFMFPEPVRFSLTLLISFLLFQPLSSQHISVESFRMLENDMDARVHHPKRDQNGELSAIIKVVTTETGFAWDGGTLGIVDAVRKTGEYWLYIPRGAQRITISHDRLGVLRNYAYPIPIEAAIVYEMRLTTARIETTIIEPVAETQWLVVTSEPDGADVYIDNIHKGQTPVQMELNTGTYSYRIEKTLYHPYAGRVTLTKEKRETIDAKLNPNYGYIKVTTTPESGAEITLNGNKLQQTSPHTTNRMPAGEYQITVSKSMFHSETRNVNIGEGKTEELAITMKPDFGLLRVITNPEPGAEVTINGNPHRSKTPFTTERLRAGNYELSVSLPMYHSETREITIGDGETTEVVFDLRPSFGEVSVTTKPETGAEVLVNGISTGKNTPCELDRLPTGQHQITVRKEWYQPKTIAVDITDGLSDHFEIEMEPTFGILNVTAEHDAQIFVNDDRKASAQWEGRLIAGWYTVEARKDKYHSDQKRVEIKLAETQNLSLHPKPMTGAVRIQTTPFDSDITINGKDHGKTPNTIRDLLIGEYTVVLSKQGHAAVTRNVTVTENETVEIEEDLPAGMTVTITSVPAGAELYINNQKVGITPYTSQLSFGSHRLKLINRSKTLEETIQIAQEGKNAFSYNVTEFNDPFENQMVFVKGGSFTMGCTSEQGGDCLDREKPTRRVTVSDFYMGKYEVTQKQWREIMGTNPSRFSGCDNCPVESVSWNDIQEFIRKLNQKTAKRYRLPTEAEWEYAARGGAQSRGYKYSGSNSIRKVAEYDGNINKSTKPVGGKKANELGLFDMSGNVWEWCEDDWHSNYKGAPNDGRAWVDSPRGSYRVLRGGSWSNDAQYCRVAYRGSSTPGGRSSNYGFRLAQSP